MLGFLKNLLRSPLRASQDSLPQADSGFVEEPSQAPAAHSLRPGPARKTAAPQNGRGVEVSVQNILATLPLELQPKVRLTDVGDLTINVPLEKILAQLSRGSVKISFGELRQAVPEVFSAENDRDRMLVALPLSDILAQLNPNLITRRRVQRQVQVPADIASPFDGRGEGLAFGSSGKPEPAAAPHPPARQTTMAPAAPAQSRSTLTSAPTPAPPSLNAHTPAPAIPLKAPAIPVEARPAKVAATAPANLAPVQSIKMAAAPVKVAAAPAKPAATSASAPAKAPPALRLAPTPAPAPTTAPAPKAPVPQRAPVAPAPTAVAAVAPAPIAMPKQVEKPVAPAVKQAAPEPQLQTAQVAPAPAPAPAKPAVPEEYIALSLTALADAWPEAIRKEIVEMKLVEAKVSLPMSLLGQALKQGRIAFSWKMLRSWIKPAILPAVSAHDASVLELPLKVVAPPFLAKQKAGGKPQSKVQIDQDIPNLFFGFPQAEPEVPVAQATARPSDTNFYVWDDVGDRAKVDESAAKRGPGPGTKFVEKYATPNEVVSRASVLDGVAGVIIALPDGLMVANRLPPDVNADTLAAFLPQIFGKVSQSTRELRMGDLNNLNFTVGNVPWKIFRVNAIFFAAFGRAGEPLPTAQLAALAAELDHKPK